MLTKTGSKLLDFGLAKLQAPAGPISMSGDDAARDVHAETVHGMILGTVQYMAPEQVEGKEADGRSDIWALGAVIYEMVTGTRPFQGETPASVIGAILKDDPPPLSRVQPLTPPLLDHIVSRCLAKDPDDRWQSARDLRTALGWTGETTQTSESQVRFIGAMGDDRLSRYSQSVEFWVGSVPRFERRSILRALSLEIGPPAGGEFALSVSRRWKCHLPGRKNGCLRREGRGRLEAVASPSRLDHVSGATRHGRRTISILVSRQSLARLFRTRLFEANRRFGRSVDDPDSGSEPARW